MSLSSDLLQQAKDLASKEKNKPRQASLRRAVSAAYYSLFHQFIDEPTKQAAGTAANTRDLRLRLGRTFDHLHMKKMCGIFADKNSKNGWIDQGKITADLRLAASAFVQLQTERHEADYNTTLSFTRYDVRQLIGKSEFAQRTIRKLKDSPDRRALMLALLVKTTGRAFQ